MNNFIKEADVNFYNKNGFLVISGDEVIDLKNQIRAHLKEMALIILQNYFTSGIYENLRNYSYENIIDYCVKIEKENSITKTFYQLFSVNCFFSSLVGNKFFLDISKQLGLIYPIPSTMPLIRLDRPGDETYLVPSHQDFWYSMNGKNSLTYWFSLVDLCPEIGLLKVLPGSHELGLLPIKHYRKENPFTLRDELTLHYKDISLANNELLVFSQLLVHKSGENRSDKTRISVQVRHNDLANLTHLSSSYVIHQSPASIDLQLQWLKKSINE